MSILRIPLYLLTKIGSEGRGPARRRVSSGASPAPELPLWSILRKFLPSVDTERRNGYNISRVRPKRSAAQSIKCNSLKGNSRLDGSRAAYFFLIVIVIDLISLNQAIRKANNFFIGHTSFRMVCWPPLALGIILVDIIMLMYIFVYI